MSGMTEGLIFWGLKFSILGFFGGEKDKNFFFGGGGGG